MMHIAVVGGGISGLAVAYFLLKSGENIDVIVYESTSRTGGKIWTDRVEGFLFERGANGFLDNKPKTLALCDDLGITPLRSNSNAKKRFIVSDGVLKALPESPPAFLKSDLISWSGKLRMLYELIAPVGPDEETVAEFILRRLGREALEKLIDPMVSGVFAGDPYRMSITSCFPRIKEMEKEYGSLIRAMMRIRRERKREAGGGVSVAPPGNLTSFRMGAQTLPDALTSCLGDRVRLDVSVQGLERQDEGYRLHTSSGVHDADVVVLASPAFVSSEILRDLDSEISNLLSDIPYPPLSVVCLGYDRSKVSHPLNGFGFLIPHIEGRRILGTLWDSSIFPNRAPAGYLLLRTMIGGAQSPDLAMLDDDSLVKTVLDELKPIISIKGDPDLIRIFRWEKAIPQYLLGHDERLRLLEDRLLAHPGIYLAGNAYRGVGMNDCIENSRQIADGIIEGLKRRTP